MSVTIAKLDTSAFYEGDKEMSEHAWQHSLVDYLESVLKWLYHQEGWFITGNLDVINDKISHPVAPDVLVFKGVVLTEAEITEVSSWVIALPHRPPPTVVLEISSKGTWKADVQTKPEIYHKVEVREYFAFDPKAHWGKKQPIRLRGWRYTDKAITEIEPEEGRLWSVELDSWLVPDGSYLHLYDKAGNRRLTEKAGEVQAIKQAIFAKLREKGINPEDLGLQ